MFLPANLQSTTIQTIAAIAGNLLCLNFGLMFGITPAHLRLYASAQLTPLRRPISAGRDAQLVNATLFFGAAVGAGCLGCFVRKIGPKSLLLISGLLQILAWFSIHFGDGIEHIYASRAFMGISGGATFIALPIYLAEITETETRAHAARLCFNIDIARNLGILLGAILTQCSYLRYVHIGIIGLVFACIFNLAFPFAQESPLHFMRTRNAFAMEKSLRWFHGIRELEQRNQTEFVATVKRYRCQMKAQKRALETAKPLRYIFKMLAINLLLLVGAQLTGAYIILSYAAQFLFKKTAVPKPTGIGEYEDSWLFLSLTIAQCFGALCAPCLAAISTRKLQLSLPSLTAAGILIALLLHQLDGITWQLNTFWSTNLSAILLALYLVYINMGFYPLATIIPRELLNAELNMIYIFASTFAWLLLSIVLVCFDTIITSIGIIGILCCFLATCIIFPFILIFVMPETGDERSYKDIQKKMGFVVRADIPTISISTISNGRIKPIKISL